MGQASRFLLVLSVLSAAFAASARPTTNNPVFPLPVKGRARAGLPAVDTWTTTTQNTFPLNQVAQIYPAAYNLLAFGDTDHDGRYEVVLATQDSFVFNYRILEEQGSNIYHEEYVGPYMLPYAVGDLDQDGKAEIIGQYGAYLQVYESVDPTSYATQLVWSSPALSNVLSYDAIGDTDRDGKMEIIHSRNSLSGSSKLMIFENTGDNSFSQVYVATTYGRQATGEKVVADLDGDGLTEIAFAGTDGFVQIYESSTDNTWKQTWIDSTGKFNAYGAEGGRDTDGNGKPELFVMGNSWTPGNPDPIDYYTTIVYEASGDNQFIRVATLSFSDGSSGGSENALGNLDGIGPGEYLMKGNGYFWIYRSTAPGQWTMIQRVADPTPHGGHGNIYAFDVNRNGRDEVFWTMDSNIQSGPNTLVFEHPPLPSAVGATLPQGALALSPFPNPCRFQASIGAPDALGAASILAVFDVTGRLVERRVPIRDARGQLLFPARHLNPGVYLLRLEDRSGAALAAGRAVVVR
jgi:hypothetical protein